MVNINFIEMILISVIFIILMLIINNSKNKGLKEDKDFSNKVVEKYAELEKMIKYRNVSMVACVTESGLLGDAEPEEGTNGLLWHVPEELQHFKNLTKNSILVFGENTAKFVPIDKIRKSGRIVEILNYNNNTLDDILNKYPESEIMICGGASVYKWCLENIPLAAIYLSILNEEILVKEAKKPLYLPDPADYGYEAKFKYPYEYFTFVVFTKNKKEGE